MNRKQLIAFSIIFLLIGIFGCTSVQKGSLGDESWTVETKGGRVFYFTHGTAVWGHEFGFFKVDDCGNDILWLTFSARDEKVKDFEDKDVVVSLEVDGKDFRIKLPMLSTVTIGFTHVMLFTNWLAGEQLINALKKGRYMKVQILEPKELEELLDIKYDQFGLKGFTASRKKAGKVCKDSLSAMGEKELVKKDE